MNMLLFTNGEVLNQRMIQNLTQLNPKISFVVSVNASSAKTYDKIHGIKRSYQKVMSNLEAWKKFVNSTNQKIEKNKILTQFAIHFVVNNANLDEIPKMQKLADDIDCALVLTTPGMSGRVLLHENEITKNQKELKHFEKITEKYSDTKGPTAKTYKNECAYISSSHNINSSHGVTIHSLGGMVLVCPYFVGLGSDQWFELKNYLEPGGQNVLKWLSTSEQIAFIITNAIFKIFGYNYCLKRHSKYPDIEKFVIQLNKIMVKKTKILDYSSKNYFNKLIITLRNATKNLEKII